jgi:hypothetical protein
MVELLMGDEWMAPTASDVFIMGFMHPHWYVLLAATSDDSSRHRINNSITASLNFLVQDCCTEDTNSQICALQ